MRAPPFEKKSAEKVNVAVIHNSDLEGHTYQLGIGSRSVLTQELWRSTAVYRSIRAGRSIRQLSQFPGGPCDYLCWQTDANANSLVSLSRDEGLRDREWNDSSSKSNNRAIEL